MSQEAGAADDSAIRPFTIDTPEELLADLRSRIKATRWPDRETDASQGVRLETIPGPGGLLGVGLRLAQVREPIGRPDGGHATTGYPGGAD